MNKAVKGILRCATPGGHCNKHVSFDNGQQQVFTVEDIDRSPVPVTHKLSYRDILELKQLNINFMCKRDNDYLSAVPIHLLPLLPCNTPASSPVHQSPPTVVLPPPPPPPCIDPCPQLLPPPSQQPPRKRFNFAFVPVVPTLECATPTSPTAASSISTNSAATPPSPQPVSSTPTPHITALPSPALIPPSPFSLYPSAAAAVVPVTGAGSTAEFRNSISQQQPNTMLSLPLAAAPTLSTAPMAPAKGAAVLPTAAVAPTTPTKPRHPNDLLPPSPILAPYCLSAKVIQAQRESSPVRSPTKPKMTVPAMSLAVQPTPSPNPTSMRA